MAPEGSNAPSKSAIKTTATPNTSTAHHGATTPPAILSDQIIMRKESAAQPADLTSPTTFADQRHSRLMGLPTELRNRIYEYVFCDNVEWSREPIDYKHEKHSYRATMAHVPERIDLDQADPPAKDAILPCRQLYTEMRNTQAAAYRTYWSINRFRWSDDISERVINRGSALPKKATMKHIRCFSLVLGPLSVGARTQATLDIVFESGAWQSRMIPAHGNQLDEFHRKAWLFCCHLQNGTQISMQARHILREFSRGPLDPRKGEGLTMSIVENDSCDNIIYNLFIHFRRRYGIQLRELYDLAESESDDVEIDHENNTIRARTTGDGDALDEPEGSD